MLKRSLLACVVSFAGLLAGGCSDDDVVGVKPVEGDDVPTPPHSDYLELMNDFLSQKAHIRAIPRPDLAEADFRELASLWEPPGDPATMLVGGRELDGFSPEFAPWTVASFRVWTESAAAADVWVCTDGGAEILFDDGSTYRVPRFRAYVFELILSGDSWRVHGFTADEDQALLDRLDSSRGNPRESCG